LMSPGIGTNPTGRLLFWAGAAAGGKDPL
jgi:hypothetical protein